MAVRTISTRLAIEGEKEYKQKINQVNSELKTLDSELRLVESQFKGQANTMESLTAKGDVLSRAYDKQAEKVKELEAALENAMRAQQTYTSRTNEAREKIAATEAALNKLKNSTEDTTEEQKQLTEQLNKYQRELEEATAGEAVASKSINNWQQQLNNAKVKLNNLSNGIKQNDQYLDEARDSTDKCATSIDKYGKEVKEAAEETSLLGQIFKGGFFAGLATQLVVTLMSKIKELATAAFNTADSLKQMSEVTGRTTDELQKLQYIGDDVGVSLETIQSAQARFTRAVGEARDGVKQYTDAFERLGIEFQNADGSLKDTTTTMYEAFDALGQIGNAAERDAIAMDIFGRSAMELNPLIKAGADELERLGKEAEETGALMREDTIEVLDIVGDAFSHFEQVVQSEVGNCIAWWLQLLGIVQLSEETFTAAEQQAAKTVESFSAELGKLTSKYDEAYEAANKALETQLGLWNKMDLEAKKSIEDITDALASQIAWMDTYQRNLDNLASRQIAGVDTLVKALSDGSTESAAILKGLADASDEEISQVIYQMSRINEGKEAFSHAMAEASTNFTQQFHFIAGRAQEAVKSMNVAIDARMAAEETMAEYIQQINEMIPQVEAAYTRAGRAAAAALAQATAARSAPYSSQNPVGVVDYNSLSLGMAQTMNQQKQSVNLNVTVELDKRQVGKVAAEYIEGVGVVKGDSLVRGD
jgi:myosin heavy subunit